MLYCWIGNTSSITYTLPGAFDYTKWHHVAAVGNNISGTLAIYLDGLLVSSVSTSLASYSASTLSTAKIGSGVFNDPATSNPFSGQIMKVGMYNTALSAATIANLAASPTLYTGSEAGLIAGYNFFDSSGTTLSKLPSGTNGTLINTPTWIDPYTYSWTKAGDPTFTKTTKNISGLLNGNYTVSVLGIGASCPKTTSFSLATVVATWNGSTWINGPPTSAKAIEFTGLYPPTMDVDIAGCSCKVTGSAAVTIKSGRTMTITNEVTVLGPSFLTFENTASLIQTNDAAVNSGNIIYKRNTTSVLGSDYTYWSSPVANQQLINVSPSYASGLFYSYNDFATPEDWKPESSSVVMQIGKGYIIRGPQTMLPPSFYVATFTGVPNNGLKTIAIGPTGTSNLLGNPYPSAIKADTFLSLNSSVIEGTIYFWTHNTAIQLATNITDGTAGSGAFAYTSNDYASYNTTGGVATGNSKNGVEQIANRPNGYIAAGQGFFTRSTVIGGTVQFTNAMRLLGTSINNTQFFKTKSPKSKTANTIEKNRIWLNLTNTQGAFKQMLVGYITDATNDYDSRFDGESLDGNAFVDFYSVNQDRNLVIQGRALPFDENDVVPLGYSSTIDGEFTINIDEVDGLLANQAVYLEDKLTNTTVDLKSSPYTFTTIAGTFKDRFVLRYANRSLANPDFKPTSNKVLVSNKNKQIKINSFAETIDKVSIYDLLGKQIYQKNKVNSKELSILDLGSSHQTLVVKTSLQNGETVTNKIIY